MKYLKMLGLAAITAAALTAILGAASASATELTCGAAMCPAGTVIHAEAESTVTLHPPFGDIECKKSTVEGTTKNTGGTTETVTGHLTALSFSECNATVTPIKGADGFFGSLEVHTQGEKANNNGTLTSSGTEVTVEFFGTHCIFKTSSTDLGTVTGSANTGSNATFDISATIPRTGGRSGAFCGSTAQWTGNYKITKPNPLNVD